MADSEKMTPEKLARNLMFRRLAETSARGGKYDLMTWDPAGLDPFEHWCLRQLVGAAFMDQIEREPFSCDDAIRTAPQTAEDVQQAFWRAFCDNPPRSMVEHLFPPQRIDQAALKVLEEEDDESNG